MANDSPSTPPPQYSQPSTIETDAAIDFARRYDLLVASHGISVAQMDVLFDLDQAIHAMVKDAVEALTIGDSQQAAVAVMYWLFGNYPGIRPETVADALTGFTLAQVLHTRHHALRYTSGRILDADVEGLRALPYAEYLASEHWQFVRHEALSRAGHACQVCNSTTDLHVHHRTYERRGEEADADVIVLCASCHQLFHDNGKVAR